jgi:hypothetical protein
VQAEVSNIKILGQPRTVVCRARRIGYIGGRYRHLGEPVSLALHEAERAIAAGDVYIPRPRPQPKRCRAGFDVLRRTA